MTEERFTLWLNTDGEPIEKPLSEMTAGVVLRALDWLTAGRSRLKSACADDIPKPKSSSAASTIFARITILRQVNSGSALLPSLTRTWRTYCNR